jgi:hypothetical protein
MWWRIPLGRASDLGEGPTPASSYGGGGSGSGVGGSQHCEYSEELHCWLSGGYRPRIVPGAGRKLIPQNAWLDGDTPHGDAMRIFFSK